jgi:hypothetical protein
VGRLKEAMIQFVGGRKTLWVLKQIGKVLLGILSIPFYPIMILFIWMFWVGEKLHAMGDNTCKVAERFKNGRPS